MRLVEQWRRIERDLPPSWDDARLRLELEDPALLPRAAALLGPANPGRSGDALRFTSARHGGAPGPDGVARLLARLDREGMGGRLELVSTTEEAAREEEPRPSLAAAWEAADERLPDDWSDLYAEVELTSTDYVERAALLLSPLNPTRTDAATLRFRVARVFGYGGSAGMMRRCLERLDESDIRGSLRILRVLSDTDPVGTQGPVWYVGGRAV